jgi:hypothetical protein
VLEPLGGRYTGLDRSLDFVLNSYYVALGPRVERHRRGLLTRPTTREIYEYRRSVDERSADLIGRIDDARLGALASLLTIGLQHELQHQELFYCEIKAISASNPFPLRRPYDAAPIPCAGSRIRRDPIRRCTRWPLSSTAMLPW